jgi:hypothetical protein
MRARNALPSRPRTCNRSGIMTGPRVVANTQLGIIVLFSISALAGSVRQSMPPGPRVAAAQRFASTLGPNQSFDSVVEPVIFTAPPAGTYYTAMVIAQYDGTRFVISDYVTYSGTGPFGDTGGGGNSAERLGFLHNWGRSAKRGRVRVGGGDLRGTGTRDGSLPSARDARREVSWRSI